MPDRGHSAKGGFNLAGWAGPHTSLTRTLARASAAAARAPEPARPCPRRPYAHARAARPTAPAPPARPCQRPVHSPQRSKQQPAGRSREAKPLRRADGDSSTRRDSTASTQDRGAGLQDGSERLQLRIICLHQGEWPSA